MQNDKVSIIVAIYNVEQFLTKCIQSIINQDYKNLEIILVDDCSNDLSGQICDDFQKKDNRIKVIHHKQNTRQAKVRNDGMAHATGLYLVFVDGDDWLANDFVSYMVNVIASTDSDMAINLVNFTSRDTKQISKKKIEIWTAEKATAEILYPHIMVGCWNKIYKRDFLEKNNIIFNEKLYIAEGDQFIINAAQRANQVAVGYYKVYYYRQNNINSAVTKYDVNQSIGAINVFAEVENTLIIRTPITMKALYHHIWLNHLWNISQIVALKKQKEYRTEFHNSLNYVKTHYISIVKEENSLKRKISFFLTGIAPITMTKLRNFKNKQILKKDLKDMKI